MLALWSVFNAKLQLSTAMNSVEGKSSICCSWPGAEVPPAQASLLVLHAKMKMLDTQEAALEHCKQRLDSVMLHWGKQQRHHFSCMLPAAVSRRGSPLKWHSLAAACCMIAACSASADQIMHCRRPAARDQAALFTAECRL